MRKFSRKEIDTQRVKFIDRYPQMVANLDGRQVDYFVLPTQLFRGIPNGLFRMTGDKQDGYIVGVSEEVPLGIQPHFAMSEHDEFMVYGLDDLDRTLHSEQNMLRIIGNNPNLKTRYAESKLTLYRYMIRESNNNLAWGFAAEDCKGFRNATEYLRKQLEILLS